MKHFIKQADGTMRYVGPYYDEADSPAGWRSPEIVENEEDVDRVARRGTPKR